MVGQGHTVLAVGAGGGSSDIFFSVAYHFSFPPPSVWEGWTDDLILRSKRSWPQAVLEFRTTRLAGQRLHHGTTGTPVSVRWLDID